MLAGHGCYVLKEGYQYILHEAYCFTSPYYEIKTAIGKAIINRLCLRSSLALHVMDILSLGYAQARDATDRLADKRAEFLLPDGVIYLDGNLV